MNMNCIRILLVILFRVKKLTVLSSLCSVCLVAVPIGNSLAQGDAYELPNPLPLNEVIILARTNRSEIIAARANAEAASERSIVVSALEDPMLMTSIDHYPLKMADDMNSERINGRYNWSFTIEQRFPLSRVRTHRRHSAEAEARRLSAEAEGVELDVELEAVEAFLMLSEVRKMQKVIEQQIVLAQQMVNAASARYSVARGTQIDVLRAEVEVARLRGMNNALLADERGMQSMLNVKIGRIISAPVPALLDPVYGASPPPTVYLITDALKRSPQLKAGAAKISQTEAELDAMKSMYNPMGVIRLGSASTMSEGKGAMLMFGISIPIWRQKLRAGVSEARAMEQMAHADFIAMQRMVEAEVSYTREKVIAAREYVNALRDEVVPRAHMAMKPALESYATGTTILATVIDVAQAQWSAEAELVMAETKLGIAWARLDRATSRLPEERE